MKSSFKKITLAAGIALAIIFTISCSEKCGDKKYDPKIQFCYKDSEVKEKCNGKEFNPETHFCGGNNVVDKCGGKEYDFETQFCYNNSEIANKCNGKEYNFETQFCSNSEILDKCGSNEYSPETQFCDLRDNKIYKYAKIDAQTWMVENLNYEAKNSKCYGNKPANCDKYGRLYNWAMAMDLSSSCNSSYCSSKVKKEHAGICPSGWHIPTDAEWKKLEKAVGGEQKRECEDESDNCLEYSTAGKVLKSQSGWDKNGNGTDQFGFTALPGGGQLSGSFKYIGSSGYWWTTTEYDSEMDGGPEYVSYRTMNSSGGDKVYNANYLKTFMYSVRCVKDSQGGSL
jgi:uncharacterized protein (TIGR02145 family)